MRVTAVAKFISLVLATIGFFAVRPLASGSSRERETFRHGYDRDNGAQAHSRLSDTPRSVACTSDSLNFKGSAALSFKATKCGFQQESAADGGLSIVGLHLHATDSRRPNDVKDFVFLGGLSPPA